MRVAATVHDNRAVTIKTWEHVEGMKAWQQKEVIYPFGQPDDSAAVQRLKAKEDAIAQSDALIEQAFIKHDPVAYQQVTDMAMEAANVVVAKYEDRGVKREELIEDARQGVQKALENYHAEVGFPFTMYVKLNVESAIARKIPKS